MPRVLICSNVRKATINHQKKNIYIYIIKYHGLSPPIKPVKVGIVRILLPYAHIHRNSIGKTSHPPGIEDAKVSLNAMAPGAIAAVAQLAERGEDR